MSQTILIGHGQLNWPPGERISDRYGMVRLNGVDIAPTHAGEQATLYAVVTEARKSRHIGDLFRGLFPSTPSVGDQIELGTGTLFFEDGGVGLEPPDGRDTDWLDPHALYSVHDLTVDLYIQV